MTVRVGKDGRCHPDVIQVTVGAPLTWRVARGASSPVSLLLTKAGQRRRRPLSPHAGRPTNARAALAVVARQGPEVLRGPCIEPDGEWVHYIQTPGTYTVTAADLPSTGLGHIAVSNVVRRRVLASVVVLPAGEQRAHDEASPETRRPRVARPPPPPPPAQPAVSSPTMVERTSAILHTGAAPRQRRRSRSFDSRDNSGSSSSGEENDDVGSQTGRDSGADSSLLFPWDDDRTTVDSDDYGGAGSVGRHSTGGGSEASGGTLRRLLRMEGGGHGRPMTVSPTKEELDSHSCGSSDDSDGGGSLNHTRNGSQGLGGSSVGGSEGSGGGVSPRQAGSGRYVYRYQRQRAVQGKQSSHRNGDTNGAGREDDEALR